MYVLYALMLQVGIGIGCNKDLKALLRPSETPLFGAVPAFESERSGFAESEVSHPDEISA